uniref:Dystonin n=1 Tax=Pyxicephalus adspersus TaxID=30357 RepID=A0AAV3AGK4_PYXAD|nr:TPA: hypothetical protein GDO54_010659 [Pyxicephalus adspersus]
MAYYMAGSSQHRTDEQEYLQAYEDVLERYKDERDKVQKKTFTKWINQHLMKVRKHVGDLYEDLRDGHNLISLLEVLSGDTLPREKGRMRFHRLQNVQIALDYLKKRQVKLVNIRNDDITDGNPKLTLGLIWTIILHFQISDIHVTGESEDMSAKEKLLLWTQQAAEGYSGIRCENFTTCWRDGRLFNAIIHRYRPDLIDMDTVAVQSNITNLENAFYVAEKLGVTRLLDPEDVDVSSPDEKSVITYVSSMYDVFPKTPEGGEGVSVNDVEVKWIEYQNMVNYLVQWIRHHVALMSERNFPNTAVELKALYNQYLQFKEKDIPPKESEKAKIKHLYTMIEPWIEFGRIKLCQGYHPNDVEKEWGKLIIAMFEREKAMRPEIERLDMLQQIASRVQRDSLGCEDKLILARSALQADTKRMESGIQLQNDAEIAGYLIECENLLRQQLVDVQTLVDGKYYQADQLVQRVASLRDELLQLRSEYSSLYSKGRMLSSDQTQLMISGISQSLNSGFSQSLNPAINSSVSHNMAPILTTSYSNGFNSQLTPAMTPGFAPSFNQGLIQNYATGMNANALQSLKLMQVKKPLLKSSFADQNLSEEEVNLKFVQDLCNWVEEMQQWRSEVDEKRDVFHSLEDELQKAKAISDQMFKVHKERDLDFDWHKEKADQIAERWQNVHSQIENRLRDLDGFSKSLKYYKESYLALDSWIRHIEETQSKLQDSITNSKTLSKQLDQQKRLISEIEMKQSKMDECQKYSEQYSSAIKDYELQLMTYRALVDSHQKSPMKRRRFQSSSDVVVQEYMDLKTRYTALMTLINQFIKFSGETLKRLEEEETLLEEEKKDHVKKAGDILDWVSKVNKTLSKEGGSQDTAEKMPYSEPQISSEEILAKQEEVADAVQTLQLLLAKHGDKMTEEERTEIETQIKALQESQSVLSGEYKRRQKEAKELVDKLVEQKVDKIVSGTIDETNGTVYSIYQSILEGLIDYETGIQLLEMQLIVSGFVCPYTKTCFDVEQAKNHKLIDDQILIRLLEIADAKIIISNLSSSEFPVLSASEQGLISETVAIKVISTLLSCGCFQVPTTGEQLNINKLFQRNMISPIMFTKLLERQKTGKDLIDPISAERLTLAELLQRTVIEKTTGMRLLPIIAEEKGKVTLKSGRRVNVLRAAHEGILEREVMYRLLGAQLLSGGIIDPDSGKRLTLEESREQGILDQGTICGILTQQIQNGGIICPATKKYLSVDEAVQCNLISHSSALMVLEAQRGFIGLIWPDTSEIFPISTSLQQRMISNELAQKILNNRQKIAGLYIPETSEIVRLDVAAQLGIIESSTAVVLSNLELQDKMPNIDALEPTCKLKWMSCYDSQTNELNDNSENKSEEPLMHNPEHTKQLFISYLMINSYIDANTGERLLLFDGDLDEAASMLLESEQIVRTSLENNREATDLSDVDPKVNDENDSITNTSDNVDKQAEDMICQLFKTTEPDNKCSGDNTQCHPESNGIYEKIEMDPAKDTQANIPDVQPTEQSNHSDYYNSGKEAFQDDRKDSTSEKLVLSQINQCGNVQEIKDPSIQELISSSDQTDLLITLVDDCNKSEHAEKLFQGSSFNHNVPLSYTGINTSSDLLHEEEEFSDYSNDSEIKTHRYLGSSSDSELSVGDDDSEFDVTNMSQTLKTWKTIGGDSVEDRTPTQSDTSSDDDTYYYNDVESTDVVHERQFLETITEEDSECNSCVEDQTVAYTDDLPSKVLNFALPPSEEGALENSNLNNSKDNISISSHNASIVIRNEETDEEYSESFFSETDVECFVTDETNSEEDYHAAKEHSDFSSKDKDIDDVTSQLNLNTQCGGVYAQTNNNISGNSYSIGTSKNTCNSKIQSESQHSTNDFTDTHMLGTNNSSNITESQPKFKSTCSDQYLGETEKQDPTFLQSTDNCISGRLDNQCPLTEDNGICHKNQAQLNHEEEHRPSAKLDTASPPVEVDKVCVEILQECLLAKGDGACTELVNGHNQPGNGYATSDFESGPPSDSTFDKGDTKHFEIKNELSTECPKAEDSSMCAKQDTEHPQNENDLTFRHDILHQTVNFSTEQKDGKYCCTDLNKEPEKNIKCLEVHKQILNLPIPDSKLIQKDNSECASYISPEPTDDTEIFKITDILEKNEIVTKWKESAAQYSVKSPIHIDNLSAIFDSSVSKTHSNDLETNTTKCVDGSIKTFYEPVSDTENSVDSESLTTYLKSCVGTSQTADSSVEHSCSLNEPFGIILEHNCLVDDSSPIIASKDNNNMHLGNEKLLSPLFNSSENQGQNDHPVQTDGSKPNMHISINKPKYEVENHKHDKSYSTDPSFVEQPALELDHPKLISSQLDQIFHIPPDCENSNKLEELIINLNKGLFPSELVNHSSQSEDSSKQNLEPHKFVTEDLNPSQEENEPKGSVIQEKDTLKSMDIKPDTLNITNAEEVKQTVDDHSNDKTLREHLIVVQDQKLHLENLPPIGDSLETLKMQLEQLESFESRLAAFSVTLKEDVQLADQFLVSMPDNIPGTHLKELSDNLMKTFSAVCEMSSERAKQIAYAVDTEMTKLAETHQILFNRLQVLSDWLTANSETMDFSLNTIDVDTLKQTLQCLKDLNIQISEQKIELETTAFDVQFFISEHAQDLSPNQSKQLLRLLNATQKNFQEAQKKLLPQTESIKSQLLAVQDLNEQKDAEEQLQEHKGKLQELCDLLTQTENKLIGQQDKLIARDSPADLQHCRSEYEELQKDMQAGASELAEIVKNTEKFLQEHGDKLSPEERAIIEQKLKEAKVKFEALQKKAEESKKELEKAVTTAIKKETEKSAAVEQLEESKNKIEGLLNWLSQVDEKGENGNVVKKPTIQQNGTHHKDSKLQSILDGVEEVNGNLIESDGKMNNVKLKDLSNEDDLSSQYQKIKAQHEKLVSQHQAVIIATQSAQALLEKQGRHLTPEEKVKLQGDIEALKAQYESALSDSEKKMKAIQTVQEELEKFTKDYNEFENWLQDSKHELQHLEIGAENFAGVLDKLQKQKVFSEDVISHKGDLRYITISGQRVLDAAKSCNKDDVVEDNNNVGTLETCKMVQSKVDLASENFKSLHAKCNILGNNLKDLVDKYEHYKEAAQGLLAGLQSSESTVEKRLSEPIAADSRNLQRQIEETKLLCEQVSIHQVGVEKLKKSAEGLLDAKGGLLLNKDEIQKPLDEIVGKYNNLSQSVNDWNEKLQITLTRSLSVQDGLDEMFDWMQGVEKDLKEQQHVPLNSSSIQEIITKNNMLEQDITSRQSSINAMNEKVKKFMETADSSSASSLQGKMNELCERFSKAGELTRARLEKMEDLKTQVELFEDLSEKVRSFLDKKLKALQEADGPGKDVTELSQYMQETSSELRENKKSMEELHRLVEELCVHAIPGDKTLVLEKVNSLSKMFQELEETVKAKEEDVSSCQSQMDAFQSLVQSLKHYFTTVDDKIPPASLTLCLKELMDSLKETKSLQEEWTQKSPEVQKVNSKGTALCSLITAVTSPAKTRSSTKSGRGLVNGLASSVKENLTNKELAVVQKGMADVNEGYEHLGKLLKNKISELEDRLSQLQQIQDESSLVVQWLEKMHSTATSWEAPTDSESMRAHVEQHKVFAAEVKQNESKVEALKDKLKSFIENNPGSPDIQHWEDMAKKIESSWAEVTKKTAERQQILEESSNDLAQFQAAEAQLKQWLVEKELMASVLGPLSIDPNMLKTQKQQVQILLKEFDARKQQYEQLNSTGQRILSRPGELSPCDEAVKEQLAAVACKWENLSGQLNDRCDRIDQAIVKSTDYQSLLNGLSEKLSALNNKLKSNMAVSSHPDAVKQKMDNAKKVQEELDLEMANIDCAKALCDELSHLVVEEYLKAELKRQMDMIIKPFMDLKEKAGCQVEQLQSAFASSQKFHQMSEDFQTWMESKKKMQNEAAPISAKLEVLESLIKETKQAQSAVNAQHGAYEKIITEGENLLQKTEGEEKSKLQSHLSMLKSSWEDINKKVLERENNLLDCQHKAMKYRDIVDNIQPWIEEYQNKVFSVKLSTDPAAIENAIGEVKALQKSVDKQRGMVEMLNSAADSLLNSCETDQDIVKEESAMLNVKVESLIDSLHNKRDSLENMALRLKDFQESVKEAEKQLAMAQEHIDVHETLGTQACSNKHLTIMQTQQKALQSLQPQIQHSVKLAQEIVVDATDAEGVSDLLLQVESLQQKHNTISQQVNEKCSFLETKLQGIGHFQNSIREMFSQFAELDDELDSMSPVARDMNTLQAQKKDIGKFIQKLGDLITTNDNANKTCKMMLTSETSPDLVGIKRDLEALRKQCSKLLDRAKCREENIDGTVTRMKDFYNTLKDFVDEVGKVEEHEESQGPVGMETEVINQQLSIFTAFQKEEFEPLQARLQEVNRLGQGLIQSAAKNTSTQNLEHDLEEVNTRWNTLNKKVAQRAAQLQEALLQCGRFQDALESILSWLADTEDLVANQKLPSAEFKVVKAQIQEQKLLQRLLDDRKPTIDVIKREGGKIAATADQADKEKILKQLSALERWWDELLKKAEIRNRQLEGILIVAEQFHDTLEPLSDWLSNTEKKLANAEPIGTQTPKLLEQIAQHKLLQEDIVLRKQNVDQAIQNGLELLKQTTGEEVVIIQEKLDGIKSRYSEISNLSSKVSKVLEQALNLATQFHSTHEKLSQWLDKVEIELKEYDLQSHKPEELNTIQQRKKELQAEAKTNKAVLDSLNEVSSALLELVPWRVRGGLDRTVTEDNERYRLVSDTLTQMVEAIDAARLRSQQFEQAVGAEQTWIEETKNKMMALGHIRLEQDQTVAQLQVQKGFTMEILRHKDTIDELVTSGDEILSSFSDEEKQTMANKVRSLQKSYEDICHLNAERNLQLERAVSLVNQFWETYEELWPWLMETEKSISELPPPGLNYDTLKQQQEDIRQLRELIAEHKPHIDKMNKTGPQLLELSPEEGFFIQEKYVSADSLYSEIKEVVRKRAIALDEAYSQSSQFHDKIDPMLESLQRIAERLRQPPSISAECEKIREQISENKNVSVELEKLQPVYETLKMRGEEMIARSEGADKDISAKAVQDKLDQMVFIWEDIQALTEEREAQLLDVLELAEKFWCDHIALIATIKDTQDFIRELDEPGVDPSVVKQQQEAAESIKEEIDGLQEELDLLFSLGAELISGCGEPDKPVVNKSIDELNSAWDALNKTWKERVDKLDDAMQAAVQYQDGLQALFDWVDIATGRMSAMSPIGTDLDTVKQQITELKQFKTEAYQQQIELERLNHQKELLQKRVTDENDKQAVKDSFKELKNLWQTLEDRIINRQHKLEAALLALGPFQHALDELLTWMTHTEGLLNEQKPIGGDPKTIEIELAKHHVLQNDVLAHQSSVGTVQKAGNDLIESSAGEEARSLHSRLEALSQRWQNVLDKTAQRRKQLDNALLQAQGFHSEIEEMHQWLTETERHLLASKPVGGLPETAREQLNTHLDLCAAFDAKEEVYKSIMLKSQQLLQKSADDPEANMDHINNLKEKWESVETKLTEQKTKLEEALNVSTGFHNSLQDFINWLTQAEQTLNMSSPPSLILDTVLFQIDEHKVFVTEVNSHRDQIMELDKTGTHLKYFSQKEDVVLIKNLLISVQSRWENVVQRSLERGRALDDARKRAKQFYEAFNKLMEWLEESENSLDSELEIANDPDKIKTQLTTHKEFQKTLGAKHSVYDSTTRSGRSLKEKASLNDDIQKLDDMLSEIRDKWDTVCGKSVERQNKLEEALLFSGQFTDALQALIDWLYRVEPQLAEDQPVHGDIDIVMNLIDNHKVFQKELGKRSSSIQALRRSARELIEGSRDDSSWVKAQMQELGTRWETVCTLSVSKQTRLEEALRQAEEFHSAVHVLLEWLAEAEQTLRFHGVLPDDEDSLKTLIEQHREFMKKIEEKRTELNNGASMGEAILSVCHPDSITTIKHWITIIRARFEEVLTWAKQHQQRLAAALEDLIAKKELLEYLLTWLQWAETTLNEKDKEDFPEEIDEVKALIAEHQAFMEEMTRKQPDVDKVTKTYKRKAAESTSGQSQIPVLDKGRAGRKRSPTPNIYPSGTHAALETKNPRVNLLVSKWQHVWLLALERRRNLNDALDRLEELKEFANFDFDIWRKKYMRWMNHKKSRVMDFFRRIDKDQDGKITRQEFIEGILSSKFPTSRLEMSAVADIFDRDGDGYIDYYEFVAALHPNKDAYKPVTDADKIEDEVTRQVAKCKCAKRFQVEQIGENKYRFFLGNQFGDSQQLRLVRILRSTVMVRVGGGWMALDEFLVKNDPCRVHHHGSKMLRSESNSSITTQPLIAKGRTNVELREKFILPEGISQSMTPFRPKGRRSRPSSRGASPNRSNSSLNIQACPSQVTGTSTPKGTPIQGSKLRLPGYLSGKGFHSTEESSLLTTASTKVRTYADYRRTPSRAGSKAGSRSSSRRGSDASDFDISEIQSVCSDMSETVHDGRPSPRASSRLSTGKPSKIPTPQRRSPLSKLATTKTTKR